MLQLQRVRPHQSRMPQAPDQELLRKFAPPHTLMKLLVRLFLTSIFVCWFVGWFSDAVTKATFPLLAPSLLPKHQAVSLLWLPKANERFSGLISYQKQEIKVSLVVIDVFLGNFMECVRLLRSVAVGWECSCGQASQRAYVTGGMTRMRADAWQAGHQSWRGINAVRKQRFRVCERKPWIPRDRFARMRQCTV